MLISKFGHGTLSKVEEFEKKYGIKFENSYRAFLAKYNGGETPNTIFKNGRKTETIKYLYGIEVEECLEKNMAYFDWKEKECLPIGIDNFGNFYAIDISEDNNGIIYFCDHERGFSKSKISDSFIEFIGKCKSSLIDEYARKSPDEIEKDMIARGRESIITDGLRDMWRQQYEKYKDVIQEEVIL